MRSCDRVATGVAIILLAALAVAPAPVQAQDERLHVSIPAQPLDKALNEFLRQTKQQILYPPEIVRGRRARAVSGRHTPLQALRRMLEGTGLDVRAMRNGALVISVAPPRLPAGRARRNASRAFPALRQTAAVPPAVQSDLVVTARRRDEVLENVPQTINVITGEQLGSLALHNVEGIASIVAGLALSSGSSGTSNTASMRGVTFETETAASPTVEFYLNDTPVSSSFLFQPLFDTRQIEILKGPQGTLRGRAAPSGAITITTRQPDLDKADGYSSVTITDHGGFNAQTAVGLPIARDMMAIRIAGVLDRSDYDGVASLRNARSPRQESWGLRGTVRFDPANDLSTILMVQHVDNAIHSYTHLAGNGSLGVAPTETGYALPATIYPGYNGPVLRPEDRRGLSETQRETKEVQTFATLQTIWHFKGQKLSYVGSYARSRRLSVISADDADMLPGYDSGLPTTTFSTYWTHEVKLESESRLAGSLKYLVGAFHTRRKTDVLNQRGPTFGPGAFGSPLGAPSLSGPVIARYAVSTILERSRNDSETSFFGNLTFNIGPATELAAGARYIIAKRDNLTRVRRAVGGFRLEPTGSGACAGQAASAAYPGFCDIAVPAGQLGANLIEASTRHPFIYNFQLSHRIAEALMVYGHYGTSWRDGVGVVGITNGAIGADGGPGDPVLRQLANTRAETSWSAEAGIKALIWEKRLRINAAFYRQKFNGLIYRGLSTAYLADNGFSAPSIAAFNFTSNADANIRGLDIDASLRATSRWSLAAGFSYAEGSMANALIPCNDGDLDGIPDDIPPTVANFQAAGKRVSLCRSKRSVTRSPRWNLTMQSEYRVSLGRGIQAYARGLVNHFPRNANDNEGSAIGTYSLVDLYAGLASDTGWDISIFVRNAFDAKNLVSRESSAIRSQANLNVYFGESGYHAVRVVPPRRIGLNLRYAFGSS